MAAIFFQIYSHQFVNICINNIYTILKIEEECELYQIELVNNHLGVLLIFLILCYYKMSLQTGHVEQGLKDQINMYTSVQLHSIRKISTHQIWTKIHAQKVKKLGIKRIFMGKRRGKYRPKT